jgi:hypothetical protein
MRSCLASCTATWNAMSVTRNGRRSGSSDKGGCSVRVQIKVDRVQNLLDPSLPLQASMGLRRIVLNLRLVTRDGERLGLTHHVCEVGERMTSWRSGAGGG